MINLSIFYWKDDAVTKRFLAEHGEEIIVPRNMTSRQLCDTLTYLVDGLYTPWAKELCVRANLGNEYSAATFADDRVLVNEVIKEAAFRQGLRIF